MSRGLLVQGPWLLPLLRRAAHGRPHLVDRVLPEVPIRQFVRAIFASLRRRARRKWGVHRGQCDAVTFVQRFGDALNLNVHFHSLILDGIYEEMAP
jgi:hypothetical protein